MTDAVIHTFASMGTVVSMQIVGRGSTPRQQRERANAIERAAAWFKRIDEECTRFDSRSDVSRLGHQIGKPVRVTELLYRAVEFALAVAKESGGAFDPTVGVEMEALGFNREYRTGQRMHTHIDRDDAVSYRDVALDSKKRTITLSRALVLDLGAIAKGLAVDMAARELAEFTNFAVDAGGDLYLGGCNTDGDPWTVGIRHPRVPGEMIETLHVSDMAVCTSGDYERRTGDTVGHHILDPRVGATATASISVTVLAPSAMVADALATAAFVLGPIEGIALLERHGVTGFIITPTLDRIATP